MTKGPTPRLSASQTPCLSYADGFQGKWRCMLGPHSHIKNIKRGPRKWRAEGSCGRVSLGRTITCFFPGPRVAFHWCGPMSGMRSSSPGPRGTFLESFDMLETRRMGPHWISGSSGGQVTRPDCMGHRGELWAPCSGGSCETGYGWAWPHPSMCVYVCLGQIL